MRKSKEGHAWLYWDCRKKNTPGYWFVMISVEEIDRAIKELSSAGALKVYLYILKMVNGKTPDRFVDGQCIGEEMISEACNISRATMYRATKELEKVGLLKVHKIAGETRALLISPQIGIEVDHRKNITDEKKPEKTKKIQSHKRDYINSQNLEPEVQLCKKSRSQIRHNQLDPLDHNYPPYTAPIDQAIANDTAFESIARSVGPEQTKKQIVNTTNHERFLKGVESTLVHAFCSLLARSAENRKEATENMDLLIDRLTAKTLKNSRSTLNSFDYYGTHRKRYIKSVLISVLAVHFNDQNIHKTIAHYQDGALIPKKSNADKPQKRIKTISDKHLLQYEQDILDLHKQNPDDPNRLALLFKFLNDLGEIEENYTLTPNQKIIFNRVHLKLDGFLNE